MALFPARLLADPSALGRAQHPSVPLCLSPYPGASKVKALTKGLFFFFLSFLSLPEEKPFPPTANPGVPLASCDHSVPSLHHPAQVSLGSKYGQWEVEVHWRAPMLSPGATHRCPALQFQDAGPVVRGLLGLILGGGSVLPLFGSIKDGDASISTVPVRGRGKPVGLECEKAWWEWDQRRVEQPQPAPGSQDASPSSPEGYWMPLHHLQTDIRDLPSLCPPPQD